MENGMIVDSLKLDDALTSTAMAIRRKTGGTEYITFGYENGRGFSEAIDSISVGGDADYERGYEQGYQDGNCINPNWTNFAYFCQDRPDIIPHLKYSDTAKATTVQQMFSNISSARYKDIVVPSIDTKNCTNFQGMFIYSGGIVEIGLLDISKAANANSVANMFGSCINLERISFAKECIKLSISFSNSAKLDDASIQSIIDGLADLTGQTEQILDFHSDIIPKLTAEQIDQIYNKNWSVT